MGIANVTQGAVITSGSTTRIADKLMTSMPGINLSQRQIVTGLADILLDVLLTE